MSVSLGVQEQAAILTDYVAGWKDRGGKVLAYTCVSMPIEIIEAAGLLPYRLKALGHPDTYLADGELSPLNCSFCRSCLQLGMDGTYDFLDGIIESNGCDHMRVMFENWRRVNEPGFFHYLKVPHFFGEDSLEYFEGELELLKEAICEHFSVEVSDADLTAAMERQQEVRRMFRELCSLRRRERPAVNGSEVLALTINGSSMRSEDFLEVLSGVVEEREGAPGETPRARLMLCGAATDEVKWFEEIERMGGLIVADAQCFGARAFCQDYDTGGDPLRVLAESYLANLFCPRMYTEYDKRRDFILQTARRANVEGVIVLYNKFCDLHGVDAVLLRRDLAEEGIPVLILEKEYSARADIGRVKTRIQAFMERIGGGA
ncbi:MAG: 2-hydroxyacyl-CoA dehydratase family protein [Actinobacteria bacterium]|nr:2-hydroxyacyl-CoA dehydratase family protein [Actinomycetota bacterium]